MTEAAEDDVVPALWLSAAEFGRALYPKFRVYTDARVQAALVEPRALYDAERYGTLVLAEHLEFALAPARVAHVRMLLLEDERLLYFRRPRKYARTLVRFPFELDVELVLFDVNSREPRMRVTLLEYNYDLTRPLTTGYVVVRVLEQLNEE